MSDKDEEESKGNLDGLLAQMPRIAEAVKAFPEAVQAQAFEVLMAEARGETAPVRSANVVVDKQTRRTPKKTSGRKAVETGSTGRKRRSGSNPSLIRDLDLAPKGKTSLKDFVAEKQPKTQHDQNAVSVYYLLEVLGQPAATIDEVFTCYKDMRWREPAQLANSLALASARKRFLDTSNLDDIKLTPKGRNHVEQDLPAVKGA